MKNTKKIILSIMLALMFVFPLFLVGCGGSQDANNSSTTNNEVDTRTYYQVGNMKVSYSTVEFTSDRINVFFYVKNEREVDLTLNPSDFSVLGGGINRSYYARSCRFENNGVWSNHDMLSVTLEAGETYLIKMPISVTTTGITSTTFRYLEQGIATLHSSGDIEPITNS